MKKKIMAFLLAATMVVGCATTANAAITGVTSDTKTSNGNSLYAIKSDGYSKESAAFRTTSAWSIMDTANNNNFNAAWASKTDNTSKALVEAWRAGSVGFTVAWNVNQGVSLGALDAGAYEDLFTSKYGEVVAVWTNKKDVNQNDTTTLKTEVYKNGVKTEKTYTVNSTTLTTDPGNYYYNDGTKLQLNNGYAAIPKTALATGTFMDDSAIKVMNQVTLASINDYNYIDLTSLETVTYATTGLKDKLDVASGTTAHYITKQNSDLVAFTWYGDGKKEKVNLYNIVAPFQALVTVNTTNYGQARENYIVYKQNDTVLGNKLTEANKVILFKWTNAYSAEIYSKINAEYKTYGAKYLQEYRESYSPKIIEAYNEATGDDKIGAGSLIGDVAYYDIVKTSGNLGQYVYFVGNDAKTLTYEDSVYGSGALDKKSDNIKCLHWNSSKSEWEQINVSAVRVQATNDGALGNNTSYGICIESSSFSPYIFIEVINEVASEVVEEAAAVAPNKSGKTGASFLGL